MKRDEQIFDIIEKEHQRQLKGIELIASENIASPAVIAAMGNMKQTGEMIVKVFLDGKEITANVE